MNPVPGGSLTALITPFRDQTLDETAFVALCERQIARGTAGLVVCGSTGEAASLHAEEQALLTALAVAAAAGRVPVIAGCQAPATRQAVQLAGLLAKAGADALLVAPTPYVKPTQQGIVCHVRAIAHESDRPIIAYDVPSRVGVAIADSTIATLYQRGLIVGLKDATADLSRVPRLRAVCGPDLAQFSGDDATAAAHRAMGGQGCISVTANVAPALSALLHRSLDSGDLGTFAAIRDLLAPMHDALFQETNPIMVKAALAILGLTENALRLPLKRATAAAHQRLEDVLSAVMRQEEEEASMTRARLAVAA
jgi:4-hydroxy-tetrahydrodipicolinate synthase